MRVRCVSHGFAVSQHASLLPGFSMVNGLAPSGGAILITGSASPYISYCTFTFNVVGMPSRLLLGRLDYACSSQPQRSDGANLAGH